MTDREVIDLEKERRSRSASSADWSVEDALKTALEEARSKDFEADGVCVTLCKITEDSIETRYFNAGVDKLTALGMLVKHKNYLLNSD